MSELVSVCSQTGNYHVPHLLSVVASILVQGPRTEELKCGGMVREVRDMFSAVVSAVVQQASTEPVVYRNSVLLLSVCPFSWHEERCVMRSSLVSLLDKLCCMRTNKSDSSRTLSGMAWAGFQVLLDRIVQWEKDKDFHAGAIEWSSLAHQVSILLSNYLSCVLEESRDDGVTAKDALQYVMELLHRISRKYCWLRFSPPKRPNFGSVGRQIALRTNFFRVKLPKGDIHHYDLSISPDKCPRELVMGSLEQQREDRKEKIKEKAQNQRRQRILSPVPPSR
ncbi:probable E3 ubiquitin-protein ligase HECTD4 [Acropora millepora]|uniref:probable E3 ubiquitin-protein ligase HECTD4 n=1 Tax=Acropora millepora TaxID=45264 RepID=UPI001CF142FA|nr:probable E3 ubiquitin-protein ligase HECTD4 [Acropora millepora]